MVTAGVLMKTLGAYDTTREFMESHPYLCSLGTFSDSGPTDEMIEKATFESIFFGYGYSKSIVNTYAKAQGIAVADDEDKVDGDEADDELSVAAVQSVDVPAVVDCDKCYRLTVAGPDAGYKGTAIMVVECAICLLEELDAIKYGNVAERGIPPLEGGVFTPSTVFANTTLVDRLERSGVTFTIEHMIEEEDAAEDEDGDISEDPDFISDFENVDAPTAATE